MNSFKLKAKADLSFAQGRWRHSGRGKANVTVPSKSANISEKPVGISRQHSEIRLLFDKPMQDQEMSETTSVIFAS